MEFDKNLSVMLLTAITFTSFTGTNKKGKKKKKKLQFLLGMPSETQAWKQN